MSRAEPRPSDAQDPGGHEGRGSFLPTEGVGTVSRVRGGRYEVTLSDEVSIDASIRGRLKRQKRTGDRIVIGDRVRVDVSPDGGSTIEEVLPRSTELVRRGPGGRRPKILAANLDRLVGVVAAKSPDVTPELVDRLLVVGESGGLPCTLVINKIDLPGAQEAAGPLVDLYRRIGYPVICTSVKAGIGLEELAEILCFGSSALVGPSGAGKSSLLNALEPGLELRVGDVSWKTRRGRHTTVTSRLIDLACGGRVADTPGIGEVGVWGVEPTELDQFFPDLRPLAERCRFRGCSHLREPDCAVRAAVESGEIDEGRYRSYRTLRDEAA